MNNKGFTLVELLAVITILGIIMGLCTMSVLGFMDIVSNHNYDSLIKEIRTSAEKYAFDANKYVFFIDELVTEGYMEADDEGNIYDPKNKDRRINCFPVEVEYTKGKYYSNITEETFEEDNICNEDILNKSDINFGITSFLVSDKYNLEIICPVAKDIIVTSNNGWYGKFTCPASGIYHYNNVSVKKFPVTFTAVLTAEDTLKTKTVTIEGTYE